MHGRERLANTVFSHVRSWNTFCSVAMPSRTAPALGKRPEVPMTLVERAAMEAQLRKWVAA